MKVVGGFGVDDHRFKGGVCIRNVGGGSFLQRF